MSAQHTPGPWTAERAVDEAGFETGKVWIIMRGEPKAYDFDHFEDAQIAAAAPEMFIALKKIAMNAEDGLHLYTPSSMQAIARAAIAKAEGRS